MSLTAKQLQTIEKSLKSTIMNKGRKTTPAERLMENLKGDDNITYYALIADVGSEQLITVNGYSNSKSGKPDSTSSTSMSMLTLTSTQNNFRKRKHPKLLLKRFVNT